MAEISVKLGKGVSPGSPDSHRASQVLRIIDITLEMLERISFVYREMVKTVHARIWRRWEWCPIPFQKFLYVDFVIAFQPPLTTFLDLDLNQAVGTIKIIAQWKGGRYNKLTVYRIAENPVSGPAVGKHIITLRPKDKELSTIAASLVEAIRAGVIDRREALSAIIEDLDRTEITIGRPSQVC